MAWLHVQQNRCPVEVEQTCRRARASCQASQEVCVWRCSARAAGVSGAGCTLGMVEALPGTRKRARKVKLERYDSSVCRPAISPNCPRQPVGVRVLGRRGAATKMPSSLNYLRREQHTVLRRPAARWCEVRRVFGECSGIALRCRRRSAALT